jgi:hypothetical protein
MNIRWTLLLALFIFFCFTASVKAQTSVCIRSVDSTGFYLSLSGSRINEHPKAMVSSTSLPEGKIFADILLADSSASLSYTLEVRAGYAYVYELHRLGKEYRLLRLSQSSITPNLPGEPGTASDLDTGFVHAYQGPRGCPEPISEAEFTAFITELREEFFESRRLASALNFTKENCISINQLNLLLTQLDLEDRKLELLANSLNGIFDQGNFMHLRDNFRMESSLAELEKLQGLLPR